MTSFFSGVVTNDHAHVTSPGLADTNGFLVNTDCHCPEQGNARVDRAFDFGIEFFDAAFAFQAGCFEDFRIETIKIAPVVAGSWEPLGLSCVWRCGCNPHSDRSCHRTPCRREP